MNTREESINNTNNNIEKLNEFIKKMKKMLDNTEERIIFLENLSKCNICNDINKLKICNNCHEKICDRCYNVTHTKYGGYIYSCKDCT